jgi:hypothetical protein
MPASVPFRVLLIACSLLTGCSAIDFAYNNAPSFVAGEFDDAFDLSDAQSDELDTRLQQFFAWHRQQELTQYRQFLETSAATIADGIEADEVLRIGEELRQTWRRTFARAIDDLGDLALTLTPQQIDHYEEYFRDKSSEYDDYLQMSAQQQEIYQVDRQLDRLERWFGDFDDLQRERISRRLQSLPDIYPAWIRYREARHRAMVAALREASTSGLTRQQIKFILLDDSTEYARAFEPERRAYWRAYAEMLEEISADFDSSQLQYAAGRLRNYAEIADGLARQD